MAKPVAIDDAFDFNAGATISGNLLANDYDPDGDPVYLRSFDGVSVSGKSPIHDTLVQGDYGTFRVRPDGTFTYELNADIVLAPGQVLTERLSAKISDGKGGTDVSTFVLHIHDNAPGNMVPEADDATYTGDEDHVITHQLPASDPDGDALAYSIVGGGPTHGSVALAPDGSFTYTPDPNWYGTDSFAYRVSDGVGIDTATVTLNVAQLLDDKILDVTRGSNSSSFDHAISADGGTIAFSSFATSLAPGDAVLNQDMFLYDVASGQFIDVTPNANERNQSPTLSADGSKLAFVSWASNLTPGDTNGKNDILVYDVATGQLTNLTQNSTANSDMPSLSADGSKLVFEGSLGVTLYDFTTNTFKGIGLGDNPVISGNGKTIAFESSALLTPGDNRITQDLFLYDVASGHLTNVTQAAHGAGFVSSGYLASISADGTKVVFQTQSYSLTPGDTNGKQDIYLYDTTTGSFTDITHSADGASYVPNISADGSTLAFVTIANNLTADTPDNLWDIVSYDFASGDFTNITAGAGIALFNTTSGDPTPSADGSRIAFDSFSNNLTPDDTNPFSDIFLYFAHELI